MNDPWISPSPFEFENFDACCVVHTRGFSGMVHGCSWFHKLEHCMHGFSGKGAFRVFHGRFARSWCMHQFVLDHGNPWKLCSWFPMESVLMVFHGICAHGFPWNMCLWFPMEAVLMVSHGICVHGFPWKLCSWFSMESVFMVFHGIYARGFPWNLQCSGLSMEQRSHGFPGKMLLGFAMEYMPRISQGGCGLCMLDFPGNQAYSMYLKTKCFIRDLQWHDKHYQGYWRYSFL